MFTMMMMVVMMISQAIGCQDRLRNEWPNCVMWNTVKPHSLRKVLTAQHIAISDLSSKF